MKAALRFVALCAVVFPLACNESPVTIDEQAVAPSADLIGNNFIMPFDMPLSLCGYDMRVSGTAHFFYRMQGASTINHVNYYGGIDPLKPGDPTPTYKFSEVDQLVFKSGQGASTSQNTRNVHLIGQGGWANMTAKFTWKTTILPSGQFVTEVKNIDLNCGDMK